MALSTKGKPMTYLSFGTLEEIAGFDYEALAKALFAVAHDIQIQAVAEALEAASEDSSEEDGDWMDGDALASAGWGTDEDYGYFGGED
jgi:3-methyladenine DNA glycosylase/8-oxoguanine DNA glycosylase